MKAVLHPTEPLTAVNYEPITADRVVEGAPQSRAQVIYTSASGEFCSGIYECTQGSWRISYTEDEFCTLIEGSVRLTSDTGETAIYTAPDSFLIPAGYSGIWQAVTPLRKFFVIYEKSHS